MKKTVLTALAVLLLVPSLTLAATPTVASLQAQIKSLKAQIVQLKKENSDLQKKLNKQGPEDEIKRITDLIASEQAEQADLRSKNDNAGCGMRNMPVQNKTFCETTTARIEEIAGDLPALQDALRHLRLGV